MRRLIYILSFCVVAVGLLCAPLFSLHAQSEAFEGMTAGEAHDLLMQHLGVDEVGDDAVVDDDVLQEQDGVSDEDLSFAVSLEELPPDEFYKAKVLRIIDAREEENFEGYTERTQVVEVEITSGVEKGSVVEVVHSVILGVDQRLVDVREGDRLVIYKTYTYDGGSSYYISDHDRFWPLVVILAFFFAIAVALGRWKGVGALLGLSFSVAVIALFIVPRIVAGSDPLLVTLVGGLLIMCVSLFLAHGFNRKTLVSFIATCIVLVLALVFSWAVVHGAYLFGLGSEEAFFLQIGQNTSINLRGLLLAGIVIGTLGVLDDITTAQSAVVAELKRANERLSRRELYVRALAVGREHIASLVNTLVLAYVGASLPLFVLFASNDVLPLWTTLNNEVVAEEIVRTLIGSLALILAVPITTLLAVYMLKKEDASGSKGHVH